MDYGVPALAVKDGRVVVSSRDVAQVFGKQHQHVLADIDRVISDAKAHGRDVGHVEIQEVIEKHPTVPGRAIRSFVMTRNGFAAVALGYTGTKASQFKWALLDAFDAMEEARRLPPVPMLPAPPPAPGITLDEVDRRIDERFSAIFRGALRYIDSTALPPEPEPVVPTIVAPEGYIRQPFQD